MFKKLLVPLDGSELAEKALPYVVQLTERLGLETTLLHVCETSKSSLFMCQAYIRQLVDKLETGLEKTGKANGGVIRGHTIEGDIVKSILQFADESKFDLILMSKHSESGQERRLIGNITHKVLIGAKIPIMVVHPGDLSVTINRGWPQTILVPLDGSETSDMVLPYVEWLSERMHHNPEITLLNICESPGLNADYPEAAMTLTWEEHVKKAKENSAKVCSMHLEEVQAQLEAKNLKVKSHVILGTKVVEEISKYINEHPFDLIAMTTHGSSGISVWPYGHVADRLVNLSPTPMLLVKPAR